MLFEFKGFLWELITLLGLFVGDHCVFEELEGVVPLKTAYLGIAAFRAGAGRDC